MRAEEGGTYGSPSLPGTARSPPPPEGSTGLLERVLQASISHLKSSPGMFWVIIVVVWGATAAFEGLVLFLVTLGMTLPVLAPFAIAAMLILMVAIALLSAGSVRAALAVVQGKKVTFDQIVAGFYRAPTVLGITLVMAIPMVVGSMIFGGTVFLAELAVGPAASLDQVIWEIFPLLLVLAVLVFVPVVVLSIRWSLTWYGMFHDGLSIMESLGSSWDLTSGRFWQIFVIHLLYLLGAIVGALVPPLMILVLAWYMVTLGAVYMDARGPGHEMPPAPHWNRETWSDRLVIRED